MRKAHLLICPSFAFLPAEFRLKRALGGSAKQDAPKVIETDDMKLAIKPASANSRKMTKH